MPYLDSPKDKDLIQTTGRWLKPGWPAELKALVPDYDSISMEKAENSLKAQIYNPVNGIPVTVKFQKAILNWLYDFIRLNVKRGRIFDLREVLKTDRADCLGYAKLFSVLGIHWGLDLGVVEILIDNRGQSVPHSVTLVKLADSSSQFVDFWYGCRSIQHRRLALNVRRRGRWKVEDIDFDDIQGAEDISYLPDYCVDAITLYIEGNRALKQEDYRQAVQKYSESVRLYPENARVYNNRAIAREKSGDTQAAQEDYSRALQDEASILRTLAVQPEDVVDLIRLDEEKMPEAAQREYLRIHGFLEGCDT
jgi:tetratricopeptide (TPR) repeat protein